MTITLFDPRTGKPVTITVPDRPSLQQGHPHGKVSSCGLGSVTSQIASPLLSGP
jgi:hypothetical protein